MGMLLQEWIERQGRGAITRLARLSGLNYTTVYYPAYGAPVKTYDAAKRISAATGGAVSIQELCEPGVAPTKRKGRAIVPGQGGRGASP
jgi:hypothetical protein